MQVKNMQSLGFNRVYNRKEDFYESIKQKRIPQHDVLVTNPPYSLDHIPKLLEYCSQSKKPFFLLMPNFVYVKDFYKHYFDSLKVSHSIYLSDVV